MGRFTRTTAQAGREQVLFSILSINIENIYTYVPVAYVYGLPASLGSLAPCLLGYCITGPGPTKLGCENGRRMGHWDMGVEGIPNEIPFGERAPGRPYPGGRKRPVPALRTPARAFRARGR